MTEPLKKLTAQERLKARIEKSLLRKVGSEDDTAPAKPGEMDQEKLRAWIKLQCFRRDWRELMAKEGIK